ncbi:MAG: DUF4203 domain-containing protein [Archaeoglobales archaeon]|nr:DUF4203 domain-containing protein [Archaeoglobales archaeon]
MLPSFVLVISTMVVIGLLLNLLGYRIFRVYSLIIGVLMGLIFSTYLVLNFNLNSAALIVIFICSVFAAFFWLVYRAGLFVTGSLSGYFFGIYLIPDVPVYAYALALLVGLITILAERFMMVLITALIGATLITLATYMTLNGYELATILLDVRENFNLMFLNPLLFLLWLSLSTMGITTQLTILKEKTEE